jgi:lipopolysaccharide/colanic/teichoic acid biosynthesis glycosyltransferase
MIIHILTAIGFHVLRKNSRTDLLIKKHTQSSLKNTLTFPGQNILLSDDIRESLLKSLDDSKTPENKFEGYNTANKVISIKELTLVENESQIIFTTKLDKIKYLNKILLKIHNVLSQEGILAVKIETQDIKKEKLLIKLGPAGFKIVYPFVFILFRVLPKVRIIGPLYLWIIGGKNRWISKTEILGRLYYCGFNVVYSNQVKEYLKIIVTKSHAPLLEIKPSWNALITLERVGFEGKTIRIHKFRTMSPYSEFLQKKIFEENDLSVTGKINADYRITGVGKFLRKYWIDELPQVIDWLRGYIKIVGIRAMSKHYYSLYPEEYQILYKQVKPGILSPLFDEENDGFNEIVKVEKEYLTQYLMAPIITDIRYFLIILSQILKGTRGR